jgi:integrase/recombinase XerD
MSQSALLSFERHLHARGHQPSTVERYTACVARLIAWSGVPAESVTSDHAYRYLVEQGNRLSLSASWFNVIFVSIVRWFEMRGVPLELRGLRPQPRHRHPPRWLSMLDTQRLLAAVVDRRYRMALQVVVATGLRVSELTALRVADLDRDRPLLRVVCGKGGDGRLVLVPPTLRDRLRDFWRTFRPQEFVFERRPGFDRRPLLPATLNDALRRAQVAAGLSEHVTIHRLRHTYAIHSLRAGMDIVTLQEQMGHRCISSTVRYLTPDLRRPPGDLIDLLARLGVAP